MTSVHYAGVNRARAVIHSPHGPDECARRIARRIGSDFAIFGQKQVTGSVWWRHARLRKRIAYHNSFQTVLAVDIRPEDEGARLICRAGLSPFVLAFLVFWSGLLLLIGGIGALTSIQDLMNGADLMASLAFPVALAGFAAFIIALLAFGRSLARDEAAFLYAFVARTTDGTFD